MSRGGKIAAGTTGILLLILLITYLGFSFYYHEHFFYGSYINNIDCSGKTVEEAEQLLADEIKGYQLTIIGRGALYDSITARDIDFHYISNGKAALLKNEQNPFAWPLSFFNQTLHNMNVSSGYNVRLLKEAVANLRFFQKKNIHKPKNAYIKRTKKGAFQIVNEVKGSKIDQKKTLEAIEAAIENHQTELDLDRLGCYKNPKICSTSPKLLKKLDKLNRYASMTVSYDFGDRSEILKGSTISKWIRLNSKLKISVDTQKIQDFVDSLGRKYSTYGAVRSFTCHNGKTRKVWGGDYGWVINRSEEAKALEKIIKKGKSVVREPIYSQTAASRNKNDIGDTYVEVSIQNQKLWLFVKGKQIMSSPIVTGSSRRGFDTPSGIYDITYKDRNAVLRGQGYASPVSYWMPFNQGIGFHDATWRHQFGGSIYRTNGSHGCVNMPFDKAKLLYESIEKGTPVVVY